MRRGVLCIAKVAFLESELEQPKDLSTRFHTPRHATFDNGYLDIVGLFESE